MEKQLKQLEKLLRNEQWERRRYKELSTKTNCEGRAPLMESYDFCRKEAWENMKALRLAIRLIKIEIENNKS